MNSFIFVLNIIMLRDRKTEIFKLGLKILGKTSLI